MAFPLIFLPGSAIVVLSVCLLIVFVEALEQDLMRYAARSEEQLFHSVIRVSLGWALLYFIFLFFQSATKFRAHSQVRAQHKKNDDAPAWAAPTLREVKYYGAGGDLGLLGDRTAGNMLEQSVPFLLALWLHAIFVAPSTAARIGWCWLLSRAVYPVCFRAGVPWLFISTLPGYLFIGLLLLPVVQRVI